MWYARPCILAVWPFDRLVDALVEVESWSKVVATFSKILARKDLVRKRSIVTHLSFLGIYLITALDFWIGALPRTPQGAASPVCVGLTVVSSFVKFFKNLTR